MKPELRAMLTLPEQRRYDPERQRCRAGSDAGAICDLLVCVAQARSEAHQWKVQYIEAATLRYRAETELAERHASPASVPAPGRGE